MPLTYEQVSRQRRHRQDSHANQAGGAVTPAPPVWRLTDFADVPDTIPDASILEWSSSGGAWVAVPMPSGIGSTALLVPTAVKTSAYTAAAQDFVPVDLSGGSVPITLPTTPPNLTRVALKIIGVSGSNTCTVTAGSGATFNRTSGPTSFTLSILDWAVGLQYAATPGIWYVQWSDVPLSQMDARYAAQTNAKGFVNHGTSAGTARPTGYASIEWFGSVAPTNALAGDTWTNTTVA